MNLRLSEHCICGGTLVLDFNKGGAVDYDEVQIPNNIHDLTVQCPDCGKYQNMTLLIRYTRLVDQTKAIELNSQRN